MKKTLALIMLLTMALCLIAVTAFAEEAATAPPIVTIDLTGIAQAVIALLAALITTKLVPWIKSKTTKEQQAAMNVIVDTLVFAAEQIYGAGTGKTKLEYVQAQLLSKGYLVDLDAIEAAVRRMNQAQPPTDPGNPA